jgi:hypothetical protein
MDTKGCAASLVVMATALILHANTVDNALGGLNHMRQENILAGQFEIEHRFLKPLPPTLQMTTPYFL